MKQWYFKIVVRILKFPKITSLSDYEIQMQDSFDVFYRGFAYSTEYTSEMYDTFEQCHSAYTNFKPAELWPDLTRIISESIIYLDGDQIKEPEINNSTINRDINTIT